MPQGHRRAPFSGKAKKHQMQEKKERKKALLIASQSQMDVDEPKDVSEYMGTRDVNKINAQPTNNSGQSKYSLQFFQESKKELQERKEAARKEIEKLPLEKQEVSDDYFPTAIDMPKRPPWDFRMSKDRLEMQEQKYFREYLQKIESISNISYFELNLETWRQLWRVLEVSDVLLIIVDIRYPVMMFPPYLYRYITNEMGKDMILVLNKVDLAPPSLVVAWQNYFNIQYPKLHIIMFTSFPNYNLRGNIVESEGLKQRRKRGKMRMAAEGAQKLMDTCRKIVGDSVDLTSWEEKIQEELHSEHDVEEPKVKESVTIEKPDTGYFEHIKYKNGVLTIGCIGTPNVGKSSLMNALMGKKVVSVSRTPGHTKHFQTIFLTKSVCLCDCPGLVFPSTVPKEFQILMGSFPIAQVKEPYTTIKFLAERIDLQTLLKLQHPDNDDSWSAMDICDSFAAKKNFVTARAGRPDTYRAANLLLRMALDGKICMYAYPPEWSKEKEKWENHPDVEVVKWIQAKNYVQNSELESLSENEEEEEEEQEKEDEHSDKEQDSENEIVSDDSDESSSADLKVSATNKFEILSADT